MASTFRFIANPATAQQVLEWFRALPDPPEEVLNGRGIVLNFHACGALAFATNGKLIAEESPVATLFLPRVKRRILWTVGEVHFLTVRLRERFPDLAKIQASFSKWLKSHPCVCSDIPSNDEFRYYFEGSVKNYPPVYAFESGLVALQSERYFVGDADNEQVLDTLCRTLRLRGVTCGSD